MNNIRIIRTKDYEDMSKTAAGVMASFLTLNPDCVLGLATGSTPIGMYKDLIRRYNQGEVSFKHAKTINLDEYVGLCGEDIQSYRYFMDNNLFNHIDIDKNNTNVPNGVAPDIKVECQRYSDFIDNIGGVDMQLLGLGVNGHIAFNEPACCFSCATNCVSLTPSTINANTRFFDSEEAVPKTAITMGIGEIMNAKTILLIVSGKAKAEILNQSLNGCVTPDVPASILQFHSNLIVVADEDALSCF